MKVAYTKNIEWANGDVTVSTCLFVETVDNTAVGDWVKKFNQDRLSKLLGETVHRVFVFGKELMNEFSPKFDPISKLLHQKGENTIYAMNDGQIMSELI